MHFRKDQLVDHIQPTNHYFSFSSIMLILMMHFLFIDEILPHKLCRALEHKPYMCTIVLQTKPRAEQVLSRKFLKVRELHFSFKG